jgi:histidinol dehydrogenase
VPKSALEEALEGLDHDFFTFWKKRPDNIMFFMTARNGQPAGFQSGWNCIGLESSPVDSVGYIFWRQSGLSFNIVDERYSRSSCRSIQIRCVTARTSGLPHTLVMASAALMGLEELYAVGGAQVNRSIGLWYRIDPASCQITGPEMLCC